MNENEYWLAIWKLASAVVIAMTLTIAGCNVSEALIAKQMIEHGVSPMAAACASGSVPTDAAKSCLLIIARP